MADLSVSRIPADWYPAPAELASTLELPGPQLRERWKYTRQDKVLALLEQLAEDRLQSPQQETADTKSALPDVVRLLSETPTVITALQSTTALECVTLAHGDTHSLSDDAPLCAMHIRVPAGCTARLDEIYQHAQPLARLVWIEVDSGAALTHNRQFQQAQSQWHYLHVTLADGASYDLHNHSLGAQLMRQDILVDLAGEGSHARLMGSAVVAESLHLDQQVRLQHLAPQAISHQTFHSIAGDRANLTFGGRIHIHPDCDGTDAQLQNKNLALSDNVTINTKPELEIYSEDVSCAHGATVGRLDEAHTFYCQARGIDPLQARKLLSQAFILAATGGPLAEAANAMYQGVLT